MRFITPSSFLFSLVMLVLPWVDVRCEAPQVGTMVLVQQKGFQTMTGDMSLAPDLKEMQAKAGGGANPAQPTKEKTDPAILVIVWAGLAAMGAILGIVLPSGAGRKALLGLCGAAALACLIVQAFVLKFPMAKDMDKDIKRTQEAKQNLPKVNNPGMGMNVPEPKLQTSLRPGFWLALLGCAGALGGLALEGSGSPRTVRRRPEDEEDDAGGGKFQNYR